MGDEPQKANHLVLVADLGIVGELRPGEAGDMVLEFTDEGLDAVIKSYVRERQNARAAEMLKMTGPETWRRAEEQIRAFFEPTKSQDG
jgi:hypothetical protein